jgi:parallel beta-helix repeat protein
MKRIGMLTLLLLYFGLGRSAQAEQRFIAANGSDAASGTFTSPWATISRGVSQLKAGDTLFVRGGVYQEGEIWIRETYGMGGREGRFLTIMAYKGEQPVFSNSQRGMIINASYVRVQGLHFSNGKEMYTVCWDVKSNHVELIANTFTGRPSYAAIVISGDDHLVQGNVIRLEGNSQGTQGHGIYLMDGSRNVIRNNRISGMDGYGLHIYDEHKSEDPPGYQRLIQDALIEGNVVFQSRQRAGIIVGVGADSGPALARHIVLRNNVIYDCSTAGIVVNGWSPIKDVRIEHNTLYHNRESAVVIDGQVSAVQVRNNIFYQLNSAPHIAVGAKVRDAVVDHNLYYPAPRRLISVTEQYAVEKDPLFVAAGQADFRLNSASPAIDAGVPIGLPFAGQAPDLGALEFKAQKEPAKIKPAKPDSFSLRTAPTPFQLDTLIQYELSCAENVRLEIFDLQGKLLSTLQNGFQSSGAHSLSWNGEDKNGKGLPSGIYLCRLRSASLDERRKVVRLL